MVKESTLRARASNASLQAARVGTSTAPSAVPSPTPEARRQPFYEYANANPQSAASPFTSVPPSIPRSSFATPTPSRPQSVGERSTTGHQLPTPSRLWYVDVDKNESATPNLLPLPPKILESDSQLNPVHAAATPSERPVTTIEPRRFNYNTETPPQATPQATVTPWGSVSSSPHFSKPAFGVPAFSAVTSTPQKSISKETVTPSLVLGSNGEVESVLPSTSPNPTFRIFLKAQLALARRRLSSAVTKQEITGQKTDQLLKHFEAEINYLQQKLAEDLQDKHLKRRQEAEKLVVSHAEEAGKTSIQDSTAQLEEGWGRDWTQKKHKCGVAGCEKSFNQISNLKSHERQHTMDMDSKKRDVRPEKYTRPFCQFLSQNPTVFHAVGYFGKRLAEEGFKKLSERSLWTEELKKGGKYYVERNGSSLIAFTVGNEYRPGNGVAMIAGHIDAITARLKPISSKRTTAGYVQLGVAPYAGGLNPTWWDRDLSIGGKVLVKDSKTGKISTQLVKLDWPIARVPTLAPHFGVGMMGQQNPETQAVPIIGLDNSDIHSVTAEFEKTTIGGGAKAFVATQPPRLVKAIAGELNIQDTYSIINWELELFDLQPATVGGIEKDFIFGGRIDDKLCSYAAIEGLLASSPSEDSSVIKMVALFDDEEIGSLLRQGARGNFMPSVIERIVESFSPSAGANLMSQTYARSFLISADVTHAVNPNFVGSYLEGHSPRLNVGPAVQADGNGHTTTDSMSTAFLSRIAEKCGSTLQVFLIRNDSRSGGTVGPTLSSSMGVRAIDCGIPQLSMHSIRATTGSLDPGLGVKLYKGFFDHFEAVDAEFEE